MSTDQSKLNKYNAPDRPTRGGYRDSDRPDCGVTASWSGEPCGNPAIPTLGVCHNHLEHAADDDEPDSDTPVWERQNPTS